MAMKTQTANRWSVSKVIAVILMAAGIIVAAYSGYAWISSGARQANFPSQSGGFAYNRTNQTGSTFNQTRFGTSRTGFSRSGLPLNLGIGGIIIGALLLMLGVMTFKYANLKMATAPRK